MATIKDVAKKAGVSVSTVSIVLNGRSKERSIPESTQEKVARAMAELGYQPNQTARKLRTKDGSRPVIAFYWPLDFRLPILASFLNSLQREIERTGFNCELVIQPYQNDHLEQSEESILKNGYNGIILGALTLKDLAYLEKLNPPVPVVLINRKSEAFSTVGTDNEDVGIQAAGAFRRAGKNRVAVFASSHSYLATVQRVDAFLSSCQQMDITVREEDIFHSPSTIEGGFSSARAFLEKEDRPDAIFCDSDSIALGALSFFSQEGIHVPEEVAMLTIGMLEPEFTAYSTPPLSVVEMPNEAIGKAILNLIRQKIETGTRKPTHLNFNAALILRKSLG